MAGTVPGRGLTTTPEGLLAGDILTAELGAAVPNGNNCNSRL